MRAFTRFGAVLAMILTASPLMAQRAPAGITVEEAAEQQVWIDEHARWNAAHMAAARRLANVVTMLKSHNSKFDVHGNRLRDHATGVARDRAAAALAHARMRADHEEARSAHHHLMADVEALDVLMADKFGAGAD